ncbi:hypothetical protein AOLI_G00199830 [Acnodon oligacanthus]
MKVIIIFRRRGTWLKSYLNADTAAIPTYDVYRLAELQTVGCDVIIIVVIMNKTECEDEPSRAELRVFYYRAAQTLINGCLSGGNLPWAESQHVRCCSVEGGSSANSSDLLSLLQCRADAAGLMKVMVVRWELHVVLMLRDESSGSRWVSVFSCVSSDTGGMFVS